MSYSIQDPRDAFPRPPFPKQDQKPTGEECEMNPKPDYGEKWYKGLGRLQDKVAIVTGSDSGIGRAVALAYAREGAHVTVCYHSSDKDAQETKRVVEESGRKCLLIKGDVTEEAHCKEIVERTVQEFGKLDVLVNNHAFQGEAVKEFKELTRDRVTKTFHTNIVSFFDLVRFALPHLKPGSSIINVGSIQAYGPSFPIADYAATKGAIVNFTKSLAPEFIKEYGIRVNCVAPGPVWTPLVVASFDPEKVSHFGEKNAPIARPAQPVELAPAFVFLASSEASYITGEVLGVTGGGILA